MIEKLEGIVISERDYSESSKIINVLTKEHGLIGIMAKGAKKVKSGLSGVTTKLTYGYFHVYYKEKGLSQLIAVDMINRFKNIKSDIEKISYASYLSELASGISKDNFNEEVYDLLIMTLLKIDEGYDALVLTNILELRYLDFLGVKPVIDACSTCGSKENIVTISAYRNGLVCRKCYHGEKLVDISSVKYLRMFYYLDISKISKIEMSDTVKKIIDEFLTIYYEEYTGLYLKSKNFINSLKKIKR